MDGVTRCRLDLGRVVEDDGVVLPLIGAGVATFAGSERAVETDDADVVKFAVVPDAIVFGWREAKGTDEKMDRVGVGERV